MSERNRIGGGDGGSADRSESAAENLGIAVSTAEEAINIPRPPMAATDGWRVLIRETPDEFILQLRWIFGGDIQHKIDVCREPRSLKGPSAEMLREQLLWKAIAAYMNACGDIGAVIEKLASSFGRDFPRIEFPSDLSLLHTSQVRLVSVDMEASLRSEFADTRTHIFVSQTVSPDGSPWCLYWEEDVVAEFVSLSDLKDWID